MARRPTSGRGPRGPLKRRPRLQVVGVALTRELIDYVDRPGADLSTLPASSLMEDIVYVPETMSAMNALKLMRQRRLHMPLLQPGMWVMVGLAVILV